MEPSSFDGFIRAILITRALYRIGAYLTTPEREIRVNKIYLEFGDGKW